MDKKEMDESLKLIPQNFLWWTAQIGLKNGFLKSKKN